MTFGSDTPLLDSQSDALPWLLERDRSHYAAGLGLGKTRTMLELFAMRKLLGEATGLIVIAPKRVSTLTWPAECKTWAPQFKVHLLPRHGWYWSDADIYLLNYEQVHKLMNLVYDTKKCPANMIVLDECACAKSPSAKRMQMLRPLLRRAKFVTGMTGTPSPNSYDDLYGQFKAIFQADNPFGTNKANFERRFFTSDYKGWTKTFKPETWPEFQALIKPYILSQKTSEYLNLPDIEYVDVDVPFPREIAAQYKQFKKDLMTEIEGTEITAVSAGVLVTKLLQFTSGLVFDATRTARKVHDFKLKALGKIKERPLLVIRNYTHTVVPGAVEFSEELLPDWDAGLVPIMIGHPKSMGIGLNLQMGGNTIVWHTPTYSLLDTQQTEGRLHRSGQDKPVKVYRLLVPGTVDEAVVESLRAKDRGQNTLLTAMSYLQQQK